METKKEEIEDTIFTNEIVKTRDANGNAIIHGATGNYLMQSKRALIAKGNLCRIKLCKNTKND